MNQSTYTQWSILLLGIGLSFFGVVLSGFAQSPQRKTTSVQPIYQITQGKQKVKILKWGAACGTQPKNQTFTRMDQYRWNGRFLIPLVVTSPLIFHSKSCHAISQQFYLQESFPSSTLIECITPGEYSQKVYGTLHLIQNAQKRLLGVHHSFKYVWTLKGDQCELVLDVNWDLKKLDPLTKKKESLQEIEEVSLNVEEDKNIEEDKKVEEEKRVVPQSSLSTSSDRIAELPFLAPRSRDRNKEITEPFSPSFYSQVVVSPSRISIPTVRSSSSEIAVSQNRITHTKPFRWTFFLLACLIGVGGVLLLRQVSHLFK